MKTRPVRTISREVGDSTLGVVLTPQRLHAELLDAGAKSLEAYLHGSLRDGTRSERHNTHRIGQSDRRWLLVLREALRLLGHRGWIYREGSTRRYWVLETTAPFFRQSINTSSLVGTREGLAYARGYFDAEGGMPRDSDARLYFQYCQKSRPSLGVVVSILQSWQIDCGRIHNPSKRIDPSYWRFYVRADSHSRFMRMVGSWHPRKRLLIENRMKI